LPLRRNLPVASLQRQRDRIADSAPVWAHESEAKQRVGTHGTREALLEVCVSSLERIKNISLTRLIFLSFRIVDGVPMETRDGAR
jgi:hypothetical protein